MTDNDILKEQLKIVYRITERSVDTAKFLISSFSSILEDIITENWQDLIDNCQELQHSKYNNLSINDIVNYFLTIERINQEFVLNREQ